jgi:hypothetical protein
MEHEEAMATQHDRKTLFPAVRARGPALDEMRNQVDNAADPPTIGDVLAAGKNGHNHKTPA